MGCIPVVHVSVAYGFMTTIRDVSLFDAVKPAGVAAVTTGPDGAVTTCGVKVAVAPAEPALIVTGLAIDPLDGSELVTVTVTGWLPGDSVCTCE